jgi:hypothetical protein
LYIENGWGDLVACTLDRAVSATALSRQVCLRRFATHAPIERREFRQWDAEKIERGNESIGKCQARTPDRLIAARAYQDSLVAVRHATAAMELAKKFYVFHQRHVRKAANVQEDSSPAEYAVIATSHSQQNACVMGKAVRESINQSLRQANPEVTADDIRLIHYAPDLIQASQWQFSIDMDEPKNLTARSACTGIHLYGPIRFASNKLIAKARGEVDRAIGTSAVRDNDLSFGPSLAQMQKKWPYQQRLIKDRNNDRELRSNAFLRIVCQMAITRSHLG